MTSPTSIGLKWHGHTDRGKVRPENEDSFLGLRFDAQEFHYLGKIGDASMEHFDFVFAVSDGMGGAMAGEFASKIAVEKIAKLLPRSYKHSAQGLAIGAGDVLEELYTQIHKALLHLGNSYDECSGMGATLTLAWFTPHWLHWAHIGDTRLYYLPKREGGIVQLSHDDTHVGWLFRKGEINEREARNHPRRTVLQRALGAGNQFVEPQVGAVGYEPGDLFLLCTDGVIDGLFNEQLFQQLRTPEPGADANPAMRLVQAAIERSGRDNTTAVVVEVAGGEGAVT
jgi:protein phosphatase